MGVKQECPFSPALCGLYVDQLKKQLLETPNITAPRLMGIIVPPLLYANVLILMSESAAGLHKQLDALASFCEKSQLAVNLSNDKGGGMQCTNPSDLVLDSTLRGWTAKSIWALSLMPPQTCRLGQLSWWQLPERHCLPCGSSVYCWGAGLLLGGASYLTPWCYHS